MEVAEVWSDRRCCSQALYSQVLLPQGLCAGWRHGVVLDAQAPHPPCCPSGYVIVEGWALCDHRVVKAL